MLVRSRAKPTWGAAAVKWVGANLLLVLMSVAQAQNAGSGAAAADSSVPADSAIAKGKYVATEADCVSCHTAPHGQPFAGGNALKSPLGTLYGPNITPDPDTGIGKWTEADFEKALRHGVSKDGSYIYPAMPYENYTKMTAEDLHALWTYMRSVQAVKNTPPKNELPFPFNVRTGIAVWQSMYFKPGPFAPDRSKSTQWNRGSYLVNVMGHCAQCHTPRNIAQALEPKHNLAGAKIEGWYAPDISSDQNSSLKKWNTDQLATFLKTGVEGNAKAVGPMAETVHDSLRLLTDPDRKAIAVYLKDQPKMQSVTADKASWSTDRISAGQLVYANNCTGCHQANGRGIAGSVPSLVADGAVTAAQPYNVIMAMLEGFKPQGTWGAMGSFANVLSDEQIADVSNYVRTAWGNSAVPNATPWGVANWRKTAGPANDETHALLCPSLATDVLQPALREKIGSLKQAAADSGAMSKLVSDYRAARPQSSPAEVVEALSTAYCRALSQDRISEGTLTEKLADFAQQAASAVRKPTAQNDAKSPSAQPTS